MNTNEVAIRCGEHAFTRLQKLLPQQDRLLPKIYQNENQYIIYWESIHWFESSDKREAELQMLAKTGSATHVAYGKWCVA